MNATAAPPSLRWPASFAAVLALHAALWLLMRDVQPAHDPVAPQEVILMDLTPPAPPEEAAAEPPPPMIDPAPNEPTVTEAAPPPPPPPLVAIRPEIVLPPPPPRPAVHPRPKPPVPRPPAVTRAPAAPAPPAAAAVTAEPARTLASPSPAAAPPSAEAVSWASRLAAHLLRFRHYPPGAERRGFQGVAMMRFSVDPSGRVVSSNLVRSSGHDELDEEAEAWLQRAQPLPPPPADTAAPAQITVPLSFVLR